MPALIQSAIEINASASRVWDILNRLDRYDEWNPLVTKASGTLRRGEFVQLRIALPDETPCVATLKVLEAEPVGRITVQCDRSTDHSLVLEPTASGVHFVQVQRFQNGNGDALDIQSANRIQLGLEKMNAALKSRAER